MWKIVFNGLTLLLPDTMAITVTPSKIVISSQEMLNALVLHINRGDTVTITNPAGEEERPTP